MELDNVTGEVNQYSVINIHVPAMKEHGLFFDF